MYIMEDLNNKVSDSFSKELLDLCNKYMLLGIDRAEQCTIILNVFTGIYITFIHEIETLIKEKEESDETLH